VRTGECEDVTGKWGRECPSCHAILPRERNWREERDMARMRYVHLRRESDSYVRTPKR